MVYTGVVLPIKTILSLIVAVVLTVAALVYSLWNLDPAQLYQHLRNGRYDLIAPFLAILATHYWLKAMRWADLLKPLRNFTTTQVLPALMIGFAGNNLLPAHLGEIIRSVVFSHRFKQPLSGILVSQLVEKVLDIVAILAWYLVALASTARVPDELRGGVVVSAIVIGVAFVAILFVLIWPLAVFDIWRRVSTYLPSVVTSRVGTSLAPLIQVLSALKSSRNLAMLLVSSVLQWGLVLGMLWISLWTYGVTISLPTTALLLAVLVLAVALPSSPGYIGVTQAAFVFALTPFGVDEETAFAASIFFLVTQWVPVTLVGLSFFAASGLQVAALRRGLDQTGKGSTG